MRRIELSLVILALVGILAAERWDITMVAGENYDGIERAWLVGGTLFIVIDQDFQPVDVADIKSLRQYREIKAPFNRRRAWTFAQTIGIGGAVAGLLAGSQVKGEQAEKMQQGMKVSGVSGLACAVVGYITGGILGSKRIRIVDHDFSDLDPGRKYRVVRKLLEQE